MEEILGKITDFGDEAHGEQMRKYVPDRYMVHPKRVMDKLRNFTDDISVLAAALLHDVLEDTETTEAEILSFLKTLMRKGEAERALKMIVELTDVYIKENYPQLNRRERKAKEIERLINISPDSQTIKYADILDNTLEISEQDPDFARVYLNEAHTILNNLTKGNPELHREALLAVEDRIKQIKKLNCLKI